MRNLKLLLTVFFVISSLTLSAKTIRYVKVDGTGDGTSWANASNSIQTMLDNSASGDEVWVAKGTYYPTTETIARDNRSRSFVVKDGVKFYGGFAGSETTISQRALADLNADGKTDSCEFANKTTLSGDIDGVADNWIKTTKTDGTWTWTITGNSGNCYRVVKGNIKSYIDGFLIEGGNANGPIVDDKLYYTGGGVSLSSSLLNKCIILHCYGDSGGGVNANLDSSVTNCNISNCSANGGGGISSSPTDSITNCIIFNCSASSGGGVSGGIVTNCKISNCSAASGGGVNGNSSTVSNCNIFNCSAKNGGGVYVFRHSPITNCNIFNCSASSGGGIYFENSYTNITNCNIFNCFASVSYGGIYGILNSSDIKNCAVSNNKSNGIIGSGIYLNPGYISPALTIYIQPTSFIGVAATEAQELELKNANWRLKEGSPCINAGKSTDVLSTILTGKDLDNNPRVALGIIDIGPYEYQIQTVSLPTKEDFNILSDWNSSNVFYKSAQLNGSQDIKWSITNQKAQFSWQTNLTYSYSHPFFSYQVDATNSTKVYLRYDMYYQAYAGTISPLGTEKLNIEYSNDFVTWSNIAIYTNANGTIANQTYKHDLSNQLAGKKFFIRFNANGSNSNRIEKWEIDNVIIDADGVSAVNTTHDNKYRYSVSNNSLIISNLEIGASIQLFDINGKLLNSVNAESQNAQIALPVRGVYLVKVNSDSGVENKKVVW